MDLLLIIRRFLYKPFGHPERFWPGFFLLVLIALIYYFIIKPMFSHTRSKERKVDPLKEPPKLEPDDPTKPIPRIYKNTETGRLWAIKTDSDGHIVAACPIKQFANPDNLKLTDAYNDQLKKESSQLVLL
jgi:hypothetical protein